MSRITAARLHELRNQIPIDRLIEQYLRWPCKRREGLFRFLCTLCEEFHTATTPRTHVPVTSLPVPSRSPQTARPSPNGRAVLIHQPTPPSPPASAIASLTLRTCRPNTVGVSN